MIKKKLYIYICLMNKLFTFCAAIGLCGLFCIFTSFNVMKNKPVDMRVDTVLFSFDRPLQLYAYLESTERYLTGVNETHVIYRSSQSAYEQGYQRVARRFPKVLFHKQSDRPHDDFKSLVLASVYSNSSICPYVMFAVDDIVIKDHADLEVCTKAMESNKAWGFFLRLGKNITHCYSLNSATPCPEGKDIGKTMFSWKFSKGDGDWGYPNNVDNTIYRKKDIMNFLKNDSFQHPNSLEYNWQRWRDMEGTGICFVTSININIPMNLVNLSSNRCNHSFTPQELLLKFQQGLKMDIGPFYRVKNRSAHVDFTPTFVPR